MAADERPLPKVDPLAEFPVVIALPVQWGDQDAFGHVNNTVYLRWFESARIAYCQRIGLAPRPERISPILASISCQFRRPVTFPDTVRIGARVGRIGRSSLTMDHVIVAEGSGPVAAEGSSVLVVYDYEQNCPIPMPDPMRAAIAALEGRPFPPEASPAAR